MLRDRKQWTSILLRKCQQSGEKQQKKQKEHLGEKNISAKTMDK